MRLRLVLGAVLLLGSLLAVRLLAFPLVRISLPAPSGIRPASMRIARPVATDSLRAATVSRDPFRLTRRPAAVIYDPLRLAEQTAPPSPKPVLQLVGIVWEGGRDPTALVEGFAGAEGPRVVRVGDVVGGVRVRAIAKEGVRLAGMDTMWVLKVREPWQ